MDDGDQIRELDNFTVSLSSIQFSFLGFYQNTIEYFVTAAILLLLV